MRIHLMENRQAKGWTVFGGYWPKGMVREETFRLADAAGNPVPMQSEVSARWPDGSIKWSRHTARAESLGRGGELTPGAAEAPDGITVLEEADAWIVSGRDFRLYHIHDGVTEEVALDTISGNAAANGQETVAGFTFETKNFSEFVLRYTVDFHPSVRSGQRARHI